LSPDICKTCGSEAKIIDSRPTPTTRLRRYKCSCGERWSTKEIRIKPPLKIAVKSKPADNVVKSQPVKKTEWLKRMEAKLAA